MDPPVGRLHSATCGLPLNLCRCDGCVSISRSVYRAIDGSQLTMSYKRLHTRTCVGWGGLISWSRLQACDKQRPGILHYEKLTGLTLPRWKHTSRFSGNIVRADSSLRRLAAR
ncbi:unnamed protein product [Pleuronectes platessa]|uniref:Uncharacterized protein n=1 Tax=Pleuronectes platessa TaxID=8262 RepID=A0A9N7U962_PLEPL|nr:unnamed protein product [Pleuronectes platessa]